MSTVFASVVRFVKSVLIVATLFVVIADFAGYAPSPGWGVGGAGFPTFVVPGTQYLSATLAPIVQATTLLTSMHQAMGSEQF